MIPIRGARFPAFLLLAVLSIQETPAKNLAAADTGAPVVLLHGIGLNALMMKKLTDGLREAGFRPCAIDYPSRKHPIDTLAARFVLPAIGRCFPGDTVPVHFVTHSMGGLIARRLAALPDAPRFGRVVMIAPPNRGSEVADSLRATWWYRTWFGPAGQQLGTDSVSGPRRLPKPSFEFGVIAATRSVDFMFDGWVPGEGDGKVSVESTKLPGMRDFIAIPATHTTVLWRDETVRQVVSFLKDGKFRRGE